MTKDADPINQAERGCSRCCDVDDVWYFEFQIDKGGGGRWPPLVLLFFTRAIHQRSELQNAPSAPIVECRVRCNGK